MAKNKHWIYTEANGCTVGLMKCCSCGKKITEGEFRYYDAGEAYACQCKRCGGGDTRWIERDRRIAALNQKQWESDANTEHTVLLQRIKEAFYEGHSDADNGYSGCVHEAWENSEAKRVHDTLKELWSVQ